MTADLPSAKLGDILGPETSASLSRTVSDAARKADALAGAGPLLDGAIAQAMKSALDFNVLAFLADGWSTAKQIHELAHTGKPGSVAIVKLGKHSITREMKPVVHVRLGVETNVPIDLSIQLTGTFDGIELSVGNGGILAVGSGTCGLALDLKLAGQPLGNTRKLATWKLPGEHRFAPPIAVP
jgi:hypothetical protein